MSDAVIQLVSVVETEYGEKAALTTPKPWETDDEKAKKANLFLKAMPWSEDDEPDWSVFEGEDVDVPDYDFPDGFASHWKFSENALGAGEGAWLISTDAVPEARVYLESAGFEFSVSDDVSPDIL